MKSTKKAPTAVVLHMAGASMTLAVKPATLDDVNKVAAACAPDILAAIAADNAAKVAGEKADMTGWSAAAACGRWWTGLMALPGMTDYIARATIVSALALPKEKGGQFGVDKTAAGRWPTVGRGLAMDIPRLVVDGKKESMKDYEKRIGAPVKDGAAAKAPRAPDTVKRLTTALARINDAKEAAHGQASTAAIAALQKAGELIAADLTAAEKAKAAKKLADASK